MSACFMKDRTEVHTVDLHGYSIAEAKYFMERLLVEADVSRVKEIVVIHGHNHGTGLQSLIRKDLRSKRIKRRYLHYDPGRTTLIIG